MLEKENQPVPKPEYKSPFRFEIRNPDYLYKSVVEEREFTASGPPLPIIAGGQGPHLNTNLSTNGISLSLFISHIYEGKYLKDPILEEVGSTQIETQLRTYISDNLRIIGNKLYRVWQTHGGQEEELEQIGRLPSKDVRFPGEENHFFYGSEAKGVHSQQEFMAELTTGLKILQIYVSELYRANGVAVPTETLVVERKEREEPELPRRWGSFVKEVDEQQLVSLRQVIIVEERPNVTFEDIGGQAAAVMEAIRLADQLQHPEVFARWGVEPPRGILFYGEPGTGKTLIAKAMAHHANTPFIYVKASDLGSMWYGQSEKMAKLVFQITKEEAQKKDGHAILYLDEVDAIMPPRSRGLHEATLRVVSEFLQQIDGLQTNGGITLLASTNRPEDVDNAFLSRMTSWIEVPLPDETGIADIFRIHFQQREQKAGRQLLVDGVRFIEISKTLKGASGRDIADIIQIVLSVKGEQELQGKVVSLVTEEDIVVAVDRSAKVREAQRKQKKSQGMGFRAK